MDELQLKSNDLHKTNSEQLQQISELSKVNSKLTEEN